MRRSDDADPALVRFGVAAVLSGVVFFCTVAYTFGVGLVSKVLRSRLRADFG